MVANNLIEIFTLLTAWGMYNTIWSILLGTGIAFIPFFVVFIDAFVNSRDPLRSIKGAQAELEFSLIGMVLVLIFCVIPYNGAGSTTVNDFGYQIQTPFCSGTEQLGHTTSGDANATGTELDSYMGSAIAGVSGSPPMGWSAVMIASTAFTNAAITGLSCVNNYNFLLTRIAEINVNEDLVENRLNPFINSCYQPALSDFNESSITPANNLIAQPNWVGNSTFLNTTDAFYQRINSNMNFADGDWGYNASETSNETDTADKLIVSCKEVWEGVSTPTTGSSVVLVRSPNSYLFSTKVPQSLRAHIYNAIPDDDIGSIRDDWNDWGYEMFKSSATTREKEDMLLALILANEATTQTLSGRNVSLVNEGFYNTPVEDFVLDSSATAATLMTFFSKSLEHRVTKIASQYITVFIQLLLIIAAPMVLVANGYSFSSFLSLALMYFGLEFLNFIWAMIEWFEIHLKDMILRFDGPDGLNIFMALFVPTAPIDFIRRLDIRVAANIPYYLQMILPFVWLGLVGLMGSSVRQGLSAATDGGKMGDGASSLINKAGGAAKAAVTGPAGKAFAAGRAAASKK